MQALLTYGITIIPLVIACHFIARGQRQFSEISNQLIFYRKRIIFLTVGYWAYLVVPIGCAP